MSRTTAPLSDSAAAQPSPPTAPTSFSTATASTFLVQPNSRKGWRFRYVKPDGREGLTSFGNYPVREAVLADLPWLSREAREFGKIYIQHGTNGGRVGASAPRWITVDEKVRITGQVSPAGSHNLIAPNERYSRESCADRKRHLSATYIKRKPSKKL